MRHRTLAFLALSCANGTAAAQTAVPAPARTPVSAPWSSARPDAGGSELNLPPPPAPPATDTTAPTHSATRRDLVILRGGTPVDGEVIRVQPGVLVVVRTPEGTVREIPWREILSAAGPSFEAAAHPRRERAEPVEPPLPPASVPPAPRAPALRAPVDEEQEDPMIDRPDARMFLRPHRGAVPVRIESDGAPLEVSVMIGDPLATRITAVPSMDPYTGTFGGFGPGPMGAYGPYGPGLYGGVGVGGGYGGGFSGGYGNGYGGAPSTMYSNAVEMYDTRAPVRQRVCTTPCTLYLRPGLQPIHLGGAGLRESEEMVLVQRTGTRARFHSASSAQFGLAQGLLWGGLASVVVGVVWATAGSRCGPGSSCDFTVPLVLIIAGGTALGVGVPLALLNQTGQVEVPPDSAPGRRAHGSSRRAQGLRFGATIPDGGGLFALAGGVF